MRGNAELGQQVCYVLFCANAYVPCHGIFLIRIFNKTL